MILRLKYSLIFVNIWLIHIQGKVYRKLEMKNYISFSLFDRDKRLAEKLFQKHYLDKI